MATRTRVTSFHADPVNVIGLYPHLLPPDLRDKVTQPLPVAPPTLSGKDLIEGMEQLIHYLTQVFECY